jgi:Ser/Thr protein kinase RdoA (MazF antagonist)
VRLLPHNPNLDHVRQQAKDVLAGLRGIDPAPTLAQAQATLAEQYGFPSWVDLKAEVERLRGVFDIADPSLAREVAQRFGLGAVAGEMRSVARPDHLGRHWSLTTDRGRWSVRSLENWWPIVDVEAEVGLQSAVADAGVALPLPVRSASGSIVEEFAGGRWRVNEWRHSGPVLSAPASAAVTREVGAILATIHGLRLPVDRISPWHDRLLAGVGWGELVERARAAGVPWAELLSQTVRSLEGIANLGDGGGDPAPVLSHNALGPAQVRRGEGGRLIVTGWEHAGGQPPAWEIGDALLHWTVDQRGRVNAPAARALVTGYAAVQPVPRLEPAMFRGAATSLLNYVYGEVETALDAADDESRRLGERSVRHLLTHLPTMSTVEQLHGVVAAADRT